MEREEVRKERLEVLYEEYKRRWDNRMELFVRKYSGELHRGNTAEDIYYLLPELSRDTKNIFIDVVEQELDKAREKGIKEGDIASDFLYWHSLGGGMPDSSIRIGVEFEVGGCHEDWGFVIEQNGRIISSGITLKEAIDKLRQ